MRKGSHHSKETREKLSQASLGNTSHLGFRNTVESIEKMRIAKLGKKVSDETRRKMSEAQSGEKHHRYGKAQSDEFKYNVSQGLKKLYQTPRGKVLRAQIDELNRGNKHHLGHKHSLESRAKMSAIKIGKVFSEETKVKMMVSQIKVWAESEEYKNKRVSNIINGNKKSPNNKELLIWEMLEDIQPGVWKFVGSGGDLEPIMGKMPDFWNGDHKLIEHYGTHWHRNHNPQDRIDLFALKGYKTLIVQEQELIKAPDKLKEKIKEFVGV